MGCCDHVNSYFAIFIIFACQATCFFQLGIGLTVLNNASKALEDFIKATFEARFGHEAPKEQVELMSYMALTGYDVGSTFGALGVKFTTNYFSRKGSLALIHAFWFVSAILMSPVARVTSSVEAIIVGRIMAGIARGMSLSVVPLYVSELTNRKMLAVYQALATWFVEVGLILGAVVGDVNILGTSQLLPVLFAAPAFFSLLFFFILPWFPQTPSWIIINKEQDQINKSAGHPDDIEELDSYQVLRKLRCGTDEEVAKEHQLIIDEIAADSSIERATLWQFFKTPQYRKQLLAGIIIVAGPQLTGITLIFYFSDAIFLGAGLPADLASYFTMGLFGLVMVFTICSFPLITNFGAKKVFVYSGLLVIIGLVMLTLSSMHPPVISNHGWVSVAASIMVIIGGIGPKQTFSILPSELTTYVTRPMVLWLSTLVYYICAVAITFITPYSVKYLNGYAYVPYIVLFMLVMSYVQFMVPETFGRSAVEIQQDLKETKEQPDEETPLLCKE